MYRLPIACFALLLGVSGCGDSSDTTSSTGTTTTTSSGAGGSGGASSKPVVTHLKPSAKPLPGFDTCEVTVTDNLPWEGHTHVPVCTVVDYQSDPPTSGNHWPIWAEYKTFDTVVPRMMFVHNHEHGAVVMTYNCDAACPDVVKMFEQVRTDFGKDDLCVETNPSGPPSRIVITPDPKAPKPIALSSWRATYLATCIDHDSLLDFVVKHYGLGPEVLCADGRDPTDPETGIPDCKD